MRFQDSEQQLEGDDCPLQLLSQLGQLSGQVQFTLRRTGPSLDQGPRDRHRARSRWSEPRSPQLRVPHKASGSSGQPWRSNLNRSCSPSPQASPEPPASPLFFLNQTSSKEEVFRLLLQQQQRLQDLQGLLEGLEREAALWEMERTAASASASTSPDPAHVEQLEEQLRQKQEELLLGERWEEELRAESDRERGRRSHLPPPSSTRVSRIFSV